MKYKKKQKHLDREFEDLLYMGTSLIAKTLKKYVHELDKHLEKMSESREGMDEYTTNPFLVSNLVQDIQIIGANLQNIVSNLYALNLYKLKDHPLVQGKVVETDTYEVPGVRKLKLDTIQSRMMRRLEEIKNKSYDEHYG